MEELEKKPAKHRVHRFSAETARILLMISQQKLESKFLYLLVVLHRSRQELTTIDSTVRNELQKRGFEVMDHTSMIKKITTSKVFGCLDIRPENVQALGKQFQADL